MRRNTNFPSPAPKDASHRSFEYLTKNYINPSKKTTNDEHIIVE